VFINKDDDDDDGDDQEDGKEGEIERFSLYETHPY
jgi:hypothetical protein